MPNPNSAKSIFCPESYAYAHQLIDFINFLYAPTLTIWICAVIPKVINYITKGLW